MKVELYVGLFMARVNSMITFGIKYRGDIIKRLMNFVCWKNKGTLDN